MEEVIEWYDNEYLYYELYPANVPDRDEMSARGWDAIKFFKHEYNTLQAEHREEKRKQSIQDKKNKDTDNVLLQLKASAKNGNKSKS